MFRHKSEECDLSIFCCLLQRLLSLLMGISKMLMPFEQKLALAAREVGLRLSEDFHFLQEKSTNFLSILLMQKLQV